MWWLLAEALKFGESPAGLDASNAEAGVPFSHPRARLISPTPTSPALKVRVFMVDPPSASSFYCVRSVSVNKAVSSAQVGDGLRTGGHFFGI